MRTDSLIVCGGGLAGLLTAKAMAPHFRNVTVLEARKTTPRGQFSRLVSQGHHVHHFLSEGVERITEFFPHLWESLIERGALELDYSNDIALIGSSGQMPQRKLGFRLLSQTRELIDNTLISEVLKQENIRVIGGERVSRMHIEQGKISAVQTQWQGVTRIYPSDFVVDCTGGEHGHQWWPQVSEQFQRNSFRIEVGLHYRSLRVSHISLSRISPTTKGLIITPKNGDTRFLIAMPIEGDDHLVTIGCKEHDLPILDGAPEIFVANLCRDRGLELLVRPSASAPRWCQSRLYWNRFQYLGALPVNYLPVADKVCVLSPFAGQGMTLAAAHISCLYKAFQASGDAETIQAEYLHRIENPTRQCWISALARESKTRRLESGNFAFESDVERLLEIDSRSAQEIEFHRMSLEMRHRLHLD